MRRLRFIIVLVVVFALGFSITAAAYTVSVAGGIRSYPTALISYEGFTDETVAAVYYACQEWKNGIGIEVVSSAGWRHSVNTYKNYSDGENRITKGERGLLDSEGEKEYLMQTRKYMITLLGKTYITEADIDINVSYPFANNGNSDVHDIQNAMTHEIGHMLGLGHSTDAEATMYSGAVIGETKKRTLDVDDRLGVGEIYN